MVHARATGTDGYTPTDKIQTRELISPTRLAYDP